VVGVEGEVCTCLGLDEPRELHDRTSSGVDDDPLNGFGVPVNTVTVSGGMDR
jgi:hypothetical protein